MEFPAVEAAHNFLLQPLSLRGVFGFNHAPGQLAQLLWGEQALFRNMPGKLGYFGLLISRQSLNLFDNFNRCHMFKIPALPLLRKLRIPAFPRPYAAVFASAALFVWIFRTASTMCSISPRSARSRFCVIPTVVAQTCRLPFSSWKLSR